MVATLALNWNAEAKADALAFAFSLSLAVIVTKSVQALRTYHVLNSLVARKLMHIVTGLIFMLTWLAYTDSSRARYLAALVPAVMTISFVAVGLGLMADENLVTGATRNGRHEELLGGPMWYGIIHTAMTVIYWRSSPAGMTALAVLCGGDGLADIVGRRWGRLLGPLPHNKSKTYIGSMACLAGGFMAALLITSAFNSVSAFSLLPLPPEQLVTGCLLCTLIGTVVESLPITEIDNITVPVAAALAARWAFGV